MGSLTDKVKNKLSITWDDPETDARVMDIIESGVDALNFRLGSDCVDYAHGQERELLLNYCLYAYNGCLDDFFVAYAQEIRLLRIKHITEEY